MEKELVKNLASVLNNKLEELLIEGLKRKGFEFSHRAEMMDFVKRNCRVADNKKMSERTYYVHDIPFFLHQYRDQFVFNPVCDMGNTLTVTNGRFAYL